MTRPRALTSPSRPGSDARRWLFPVLVAASTLGFPAVAQELPRVDLPSALLTVDQDSLFRQSAFGRRVADEIEARSRALAAENRALEAELVAEELALTEARPTLDPAEFRARADAFDARVQAIRAEQDRKSRDLAAFQKSEEERFAAAIGEVLTDIARTRGALAVIDRRLLLVSADEIDVTAEAVARIDARLGEGTTPN